MSSACCDIQSFFTMLRRAAESTRRLALGIHDRIPHHHHNHGRYYHYDFYVQTPFLEQTSYQQAMKGIDHHPHRFLFKLLFEGVSDGGATVGAAAGAGGLLGFMTGLRTRVYNHFMKELHTHCRRYHGHSHGHGHGRGGPGGRSRGGRNGRHGRHSHEPRFGYGSEEIPPRFSFEYHKMRLKHRLALKHIKLKAFAAKYIHGLGPRQCPSNSMGSPRSFFYTRHNYPFGTSPAFWIQNSYWNSSFNRGVRLICNAPKAGLYEFYKAKKDQYKMQEQQAMKNRFRLNGRILSSGGSRLMGNCSGYESPSSMMKVLWFQQTRGYISSSNSYTSHIDRISPFEIVEETNRIVGGSNDYYCTQLDTYPIGPSFEEVVEVASVILQPFQSELQQTPQQVISEEAAGSVVLVGIPSMTSPVEVTPFDVLSERVTDHITATAAAVPEPSTNYFISTERALEESVSPPVESSFVDFDVTPRFSLPTSGVDLTDEALLTIEQDMEVHLQEIRSIISDIRRIANLGELPISIERNGNIIRVHFPNADSKRVEQLLLDLEVSRGIIMDNIGPNHLLSFTRESSVPYASTGSERSLPSSGSPSSPMSPPISLSSVDTPPSLSGLAPLDPLPAPTQVMAIGLPEEEYTWSYVGGSINSDIPTPELTESCGSTASSGECSSLLMSMRV